MALRVRTPLWFAENDGKLYFMTRNDSWKYKRIRNNPNVKRSALHDPRQGHRARISPLARDILPPQEWPEARKVIRQKYWLARLPFWSNKNEYLEIEIPA